MKLSIKNPATAGFFIMGPITGPGLTDPSLMATRLAAWSLGQERKQGCLHS